MLRKSVETRDWLNTIEPRNVRAVMKRVVEDITAIDTQVNYTSQHLRRTLGYKTFFSSSTEHEISTAHKSKKLKNKDFSYFKSFRGYIYHANNLSFLS